MGMCLPPPLDVGGYDEMGEAKEGEAHPQGGMGIQGNRFGL